MPELVPEQREAVEDRGRDLFLDAGAGSGKTAVLVERFCEAVLAQEGAEADVGIDQVLAFTFTEKAAGELKRRVREALRERGRPDLAREAEGAFISTIHAFCQRLLSSHPLAAGLDPRFSVLDAGQAERLALEAFDSAFERWAQGPGDERFEVTAAFSMRGLRETIRTAHDELRSRGCPVELPELGAPDLEGALAELRA
ncbi:MAG: UvrD-helicase domain-containing protein, partial [Thermoleophilaceae bacterium]|nr:UvrD-helicase domain-containing protein [Thermoleophilaceae bacterium]